MNHEQAGSQSVLWVTTWFRVTHRLTSSAKHVLRRASAATGPHWESRAGHNSQLPHQVPWMCLKWDKALHAAYTTCHFPSLVFTVLELIPGPPVCQTRALLLSFGFLAFRLTSFCKHGMTLKHHFALQVGEFVLCLCNFDESKNLYLSCQVHFPGEFGLIL